MKGCFHSVLLLKIYYPSAKDSVTVRTWKNVSFSWDAMSKCLHFWSTHLMLRLLWQLLLFPQQQYIHHRLLLLVCNNTMQTMNIGYLSSWTVGMTHCCLIRCTQCHLCCGSVSHPWWHHACFLLQKGMWWRECVTEQFVTHSWEQQGLSTIAWHSSFLFLLKLDEWFWINHARQLQMLACLAKGLIDLASRRLIFHACSNWNTLSTVPLSISGFVTEEGLQS